MPTIDYYYKDARKKLYEKKNSNQPYEGELKRFAVLQGMRDQYGPEADAGSHSNEFAKFLSSKNYACKTFSKEEEQKILDGSNLFYYNFRYPKIEDRLSQMSNKAFLEFEDSVNQSERINKKGKNIFKQNREAAVELERMLTALPPEKKNGKDFEVICDAVYNMTLHGTYKFRQHTDIDGNKVDSNTSEMNRETLVSGMRNIKQVTDKAKDVSPEVRDMVQGFIWRQNVKNMEFLKNKPFSAEEKEKIAQDRVRREAKLKEGEKLEFDKGWELDSRGYAFFKKGGLFGEASRKYNKATLLNRGSDQYKDVGNALSELNKEVEQYAKLRYPPKGAKPTDPERLNERAKVIQEKIAALKKANAAYFDHKIKDGQWRKGTNARADKRIEAVRGLDEMADSLNAFITEEIAFTDKKLEPKRNKEVIDIPTEAQRAKEKLIKATLSLDNSFPDKEDFKYELAVITVAASLKEGDKTKTTRGNFNKNINEVIEKNEKFNYMMNNNSSETLFRHAMEDKGQKLYNDYQVCADKLKKLNEQKEEFKQEKKKQVIKSKDDMKLSANDTIKRSKTFSKKT